MSYVRIDVLKWPVEATFMIKQLEFDICMKAAETEYAQLYFMVPRKTLMRDKKFAQPKESSLRFDKILYKLTKNE